jgi:hypothetical protein
VAGACIKPNNKKSDPFLYPTVVCMNDECLKLETFAAKDPVKQPDGSPRA